MLTDARDDILDDAAAGLMVEHVVDGDQWDTGLIRHVCQAIEPRAIVAFEGWGCGEPHSLRRPRREAIKIGLRD